MLAVFMVVTAAGAPNVWVVGGDVDSRGRAQRALEGVFPASSSPTDGDTMDLGEEFRELLKRVENAYYEERYAQIDILIGSASDTLRRSNRRHAAHLDLWLAAARLASGDRVAAAARAADALRRWPRLKVDLAILPPSVKKLVDEVRKTLPDPVVLSIDTWPAQTRVSVDGFAVAARAIELFPGAHQLAFAASGHERVERTIDVERHTRVALSLPRPIPGWLQSGQPPPGACGLVATILPKGGVQGSWLCEEATAESPVFATAPELASWAAEIATTEAPDDESESSELSTELDIAAGASLRSRSLTAVGAGNGYDLSLRGVGARVGFCLRWRDLFASVGVGWLSFAPTTIRIVEPASGERLTLNAGNELRIRSALGYELALGSGFSLHGSAGAFWSKSFLPDVERAQEPTGIFPSLSVLLLELRVGAVAEVIPIDDVSVVHIAVDAGVQPVGTVAESPSGSTGADPTPAPTWLWAVEIGMRSPIAVALFYEGDHRTLSFSGPARAPHDPAIADATQTETSHLFGVLWRPW